MDFADLCLDFFLCLEFSSNDERIELYWSFQSVGTCLPLTVPTALWVSASQCVSENTLLTKAALMTEMQVPESTRRSTGEPSIVAVTKALFVSLLGPKSKLCSGDIGRSSCLFCYCSNLSSDFGGLREHLIWILSVRTVTSASDSVSAVKVLLSGDSDLSRGSSSAGGLGIAVTGITRTFVALSLVQISIRTTISCLSFSIWDSPSISALVVMESVVLIAGTCVLICVELEGGGWLLLA